MTSSLPYTSVSQLARAQAERHRKTKELNWPKQVIRHQNEKINWTKMQTLEKACLAKVLVLVYWETSAPTPSSRALFFFPAFNILVNVGVVLTYPILISIGTVLSVPGNAGTGKYGPFVCFMLWFVSSNNRELRPFPWKLFLNITRSQTTECAADLKSAATKALFYLDVLLELNTKCIIWVSCDFPDNLILWYF